MSDNPAPPLETPTRRARITATIDITYPGANGDPLDTVVRRSADVLARNMPSVIASALNSCVQLVLARSPEIDTKEHVGDFGLLVTADLSTSDLTPDEVAAILNERRIDHAGTAPSTTTPQ